MQASPRSLYDGSVADRAIQNYRELHRANSLKTRLRTFARDSLIFGLSLTGRPPRDTGWVRFPYYHHVFDDERSGFSRQLRYMRNLGEFVDLDDAIAILEAGKPPDGRYFCLTFDDGFRNCLTNGVPILLDHDAPCAFFVPTSYIGTTLETDAERIRRFYGPGRSIIEFLDWDEVRAIDAAGMTIGSHTVSHSLLIDLTEQQVAQELEESKKVIEQQLGKPCDHFCAPRGRPGLDFDPERDPRIAAELGYRSFLATKRGSFQRVPPAMEVERDHTLALWGVYQLRYFLAR